MKTESGVFEQDFDLHLKFGVSTFTDILLEVVSGGMDGPTSKYTHVKGAPNE